MQTTKKITVMIIFLIASTWTYAQKGVGNKSGMAGLAQVNEQLRLYGTLQEVVNEPCTQTTGRYSNGTHLMILTEQGGKQTLNLHLGPTKVLSDITGQLKAGKSIQLEVFRTDDLADQQYIVKEFTYQGETFEIRDENLRPFWAGNRRGIQGSGR